MSFQAVALEAIREVAEADAHIGQYLDRDLVDGTTVLRFAATHPGYPHWRWCVALTGDDAHPSVNEVWMEPGDGALTIPAWKPWSERVRPGDLGAGDVVETRPDDPRLDPGYTGVGDLDDVDAALHPLQWQLGLGRERVLSPEGVADAVDRWRRSDHGPESQVARLADHQCSTCAWLLPIGGRLGQAFGVCAHDMSPSDGHMVSMDHGCGAHSAAVATPSHVPVTEIIIDDDTFLDVETREAGHIDEPQIFEDDAADGDESAHDEDVEAFSADVDGGLPAGGDLNDDDDDDHDSDDDDDLDEDEDDDLDEDDDFDDDEDDDLDEDEDDDAGDDR